MENSTIIQNWKALIKPSKLTRPLRKGDVFHIVAASSPINSKEDLFSGIKVLEEWGLICRNRAINDRYWGYLAGEDQLRYHELHPE